MLGPIIEGPVSSLAAAIESGGYRALEQALGVPPSELVRVVELSGLRGRGGAGSRLERNGAQLPNRKDQKSLQFQTPTREIPEPISTDFCSKTIRIA